MTPVTANYNGHVITPPPVVQNPKKGPTGCVGKRLNQVYFDARGLLFSQFKLKIEWDFNVLGVVV